MVRLQLLALAALLLAGCATVSVNVSRDVAVAPVRDVCLD